MKLSEQGHFTWKEWADDGSRYYDHWLAALERLLTLKELTGPAELLARKEAWAEAYRHTPHGKPVELSAAAAEPDQQ